MGGRRVACLVGSVGLLASQAGHLLAYELRFGTAAQYAQSWGAHAYFPTVAKTGLGLLGATLVTALLIVGLARVVAGSRIEKNSAPAYLRLLAGLFTLQLAVFAVQETVEAAASGAPASSAVVLLLWGTAGQLPVAALAALAVRWLLARLRPALALIQTQIAPAVRTVVFALAPRQRPAGYVAALVDGRFAFAFTRRGPPL